MKSPALIILLALLSTAPIHIGHGLIGDLNPQVDLQLFRFLRREVL